MAVKSSTSTRKRTIPVAIQENPETPNQKSVDRSLPTDSNTVTFRGSICFYCALPLMTNLQGTIVHHEDKTPYKQCRPYLKSKEKANEVNDKGTRNLVLL